MIYAGFDTETTGLCEPEHRIIELHIEFRTNYKSLMNKTFRFDPQRSISEAAYRVHKIDLGMLAGEKTFAELAPTIAAMLSRADVVVAHNGIGFDWPFMQMECRRVGVKLPEVKLFDTMVEGRWATPDGKNPSLGELCFATGVDYDSSAAHAADYDVRVNLDAFERGYKMGFFKLDGMTIGEASKKAA